MSETPRNQIAFFVFIIEHGDSLNFAPFSIIFFIVLIHGLLSIYSLGPLAPLLHTTLPNRHFVHQSKSEFGLMSQYPFQKSTSSHLIQTNLNSPIRFPQDLARRLDGLGLACKGDAAALSLELQTGTEAILAASRRADEGGRERAAGLEERVREAKDCLREDIRKPAESVEALKTSVEVS